jgi:hypothetical protein
MYDVEVVFSGIAFIPLQEEFRIWKDAHTNTHTHNMVFLNLAFNSSFLSFFLSLFKEREVG